MTTKTISGHYGPVFSIEHNNRIFTPSNVDGERSKNNYYAVAAGQLAMLDLEETQNLSDFWDSYRRLSEIYWDDYTASKEAAFEEFSEQLAVMRKYRQAWHMLTDDDMCAIISMLFLPLLIPCGIYLDLKMQKAREAYDSIREENWIRNEEFKAAKISLREALAEQDITLGTQYLQIVDSVVREMAQKANDHLAFAQSIPSESPAPLRCATLEEIYDKLFEPSFQEFQKKQRPCRRYNGTYLESIREGQREETRKNQQSKNCKSRKTMEAVEIVFCIGDMDNTGYLNASQDAKQAEVLLKDFCDHLMEKPKVCCVTSRELADPNWQPPFRNGLIVLNLTVHCDEATPGVHLTCIPYSRGCKRGPNVQAALGRALTGMGYPSTWKDALDENGERIPKRTKAGELVYNSDGSVRYRREPDGQGIIDWIEEEKQWIQSEMASRYGWQREYKGSHPRGNLSTPEYKVARAKERKELLEREIKAEIGEYVANVRGISLELQTDVKKWFNESSIYERVLCFLKHCPDDEYDQLIEKVNEFWLGFTARKEKMAIDDLKEKIKEAEKKKEAQHKAEQGEVRNKEGRIK